MDKDEIYRIVASQIKYLTGNDDKGALAKLRRGAGKEPGSVPDIWEYTIGALPEGAKEDAENAVHIALTLFAVHRQGTNITGLATYTGENEKSYPVTFGAAVRKLKDGANNEAVTRRFNTAATADTISELAVHVRSLIQLLRTKNIDMNYAKFAEELYLWRFDTNKIRLKWGRDFWKQNKQKNERKEEKNDDE